MGSRWSYALAVLAPLIAILALGLFQADRLDVLRNLVFDTYQRLEPRAWDPESPVRIVDIDDESLKRLGQWPWPRARLGKIVTRLRDQGAAAIAFDIMLSEPDRLDGENMLARLPDTPARRQIEQELAAAPSQDEALAEAIGQAPVVLGTILTNGAGGVDHPTRHGLASAGDDPLPFLPVFSGAVLPLPVLAAKASGFGAMNWLPDRDQTLRRVPLVLRLGDKIIPGLAAEALRVAQGASTYVVRASNASGQTSFGAKTGINAVKIGAAEVATDPQGELRVRFSHTQTGRFLPAWKLLEGSVPDSEIAGRIILIGTSAAGLLDQRATPVDAAVPGVEVHAQVIEHILGGYSLIRPDWALGLELLIAALAGLAIALLLPRVEAVGTAVGGIAAIAALIGVSWWAFSSKGLLVDPLFPTATVAAVYLSGVITLYRTEQKQKQWVRDAFGRFVSPDVVAQLTRDPSKLVLGGETRDITVMFCDIRRFTTISEGLNAQELTAFMNSYLDPLSEVVMNHRATLDKYIGDAIMAFWNAPLDDPDHARQAAKASLVMVEELEKLNAGWKAEAEKAGRPYREVKFGIGLATGSCSVGNFGSSRRFDYSAFGDDVNLSSRLEGASKTYGVTILAAEPTRDAASDFAWLEADAVKVKGKTKAVRIFTLAGDVAHAATEDFAKLAKIHAAMMESFRAGRFMAALGHSEKARNLADASLKGLYDHMDARCRDLIAHPPPKDWDGVTEFAHK
jgi:adenylate cyclase